MNERTSLATHRDLSLDRWTYRVMLLVWILVAAAAISLRFKIAELDSGRVFPDTPGYVRVAENDVTSEDFLAGERPFTLPLLYKLLGISLDDFQTASSIQTIIVAQTVLAAASWLVLGVAVALQLSSAFVKTGALILVQLFGLSLHISQWDSLLLSESISTSLTACLLGVVLLKSHERASKNRLGMLSRVALDILTILIVVLYAFSRDLNAYFLLLVALIGLLPTLLFRMFTDSRVDNGLLKALVLVIGVFVLSQASVAKGERWRMPFYGTIQQRVLTNETELSRFVELGMPIEEFPDFLDVHLPRRSFYTRLNQSQRMQEFVDWMDHRGRQAYLVYLITNPRESIAAVLADHQSLLSPLSIEYRSSTAATPAWLEQVTGIMYPLGPSVSLLLPLGLVFATLCAVLNQGRDALWQVATILLATAPPLMFIVWHSDSIEIERHAFQLGLHLRLGVLFLFLTLGERLTTQARRLVGGSFPRPVPTVAGE